MIFLLANFIVNLIFPELLNSPNIPKPLPLPYQNTELVTVTRVIDGDTFEISGGYKVRLIGVNAPESVAPGRKIACFGNESSNFTKQVLEGKNVRLEKDVRETDKYQRLLRYVYIDGKMFNEMLVREGYAYSSTYPPDVKYQNLLRDAQVKAKLGRNGLWSTCQ